MCGRVFIGSDLNTLLANFAWADPSAAQGLGNQFPRYNGGPGVSYPIIIMEVDRSNNLRASFVSAKWGLMPQWAKPGGRPPPINARCEGISTNGMFRNAYRSRRCLVPINGFFEWKDIYGTGKNKQPYAIAIADGSPFCLAGIWEARRNEDGIEERNFCIVTCEPNEMMATIHDRMPVVLHRDDYERWLSSDTDPSDLLKPFPAELMKMWKIGRNVGNVRNNTPDIIVEIEDEDKEPPLL